MTERFLSEKRKGEVERNPALGVHFGLPRSIRESPAHQRRDNPRRWRKAEVPQMMRRRICDTTGDNNYENFLTWLDISFAAILAIHELICVETKKDAGSLAFIDFGWSKDFCSAMAYAEEYFWYNIARNLCEVWNAHSSAGPPLPGEPVTGSVNAVTKAEKKCLSACNGREEG